MELRSLGHRAPALWVLLPFATGLALGHTGAPPAVPGLWLGGAAVALLIAALWPRAWAVGLAVGLVAVGLAAYQLTRDRLPAWDSLPPREARLVVRIEQLFPVDPSAGRWSGLGRIESTDAHLAELVGQRISFSATVPRERAAPPRGTVLRLTGVLTPLPWSAPARSFAGYLTAAGINFQLSRARLDAIVAEASAYEHFCAALLARFDAVLRIGLAKQGELGGVYRAMMLGQKQELTDEQDTVFMQSGTLHLFAISGLHISAIALGVQAVLAALRLPGRVQFAIAVVVLWLYVDATGRTSSAVRAFIMMVLFHGARVFRVPGNALSTLACSAVVVLAVDPLQLFSAGFQMSYGIVAALLLLGLPLSEAWQRRETWFTRVPVAARTTLQRHLAAYWGRVQTAIAFGLAATLIGTISGIAFFGLLTPGSFFANLVLIPASILVILAGLAALVGGLLGLGGLTVIFNHAGVLVLTGIDAVVRELVTWPGAFLPAGFRATWIGPGAFALMLAALAFGYTQRWSRAAGGYWPPFALLALLLAAGTVYGR